MATFQEWAETQSRLLALENEAERSNKKAIMVAALKVESWTTGAFGRSVLSLTSHKPINTELDAGAPVKFKLRPQDDGETFGVIRCVQDLTVQIVCKQLPEVGHLI